MLRHAFILLLASFALFMFGCSANTQLAQVVQPGSEIREATLIPDDWCGDPTTTILYAGQNINIGTVTVYNNDGFVYVDFQTVEPWVLTETHVAVYENLSDFPTTKSGNPKVGQFAYDIDSEIPYTITCGNSLYVAAHASVVKLDGYGNVIQQETAWGNGTPFNQNGSWAMYFTHEIQCCYKDPPLPPPDTLVQMRVFEATQTYITTQLTNVPSAPAGEDPYEVWNGNWPGWCADKYNYVYINTPYNTRLLSSMSPEYWPNDPRLNLPWDKINYVINHKQGNATDVQSAIWYFTDGLAPTAVGQLMVNDANANGEGWWPGEGQILALICYVNSTVQITFIEIDP
jgi:hypothetical protein